MIKSYTDLEQSKKLAEILPLERADMTLPFRHPKNDEYIPGYVASRNYVEVYNEMMKLPAMEKEDVCKLIKPSWSFAALFGALPNKIVSHETAFEGEDAEGINDIYHKCIKPTEDGRYTCCYLGNGCKYEYIADNPVDACVAMIEKLNELNLL